MARSTRSKIVVDSEANAPLTVDIEGDSVTAYTERIGGDEITLPVDITERTTLWLAPGVYTVVCTWKGVAVKTASVRFPGANSEAQITVTKVDIDLAELGSAIGSGGSMVDGDTSAGSAYDVDGTDAMAILSANAPVGTALAGMQVSGPSGLASLGAASDEDSARVEVLGEQVGVHGVSGDVTAGSQFNATDEQASSIVESEIPDVASATASLVAQNSNAAAELTAQQDDEATVHLAATSTAGTGSVYVLSDADTGATRFRVVTDRVGFFDAEAVEQPDLPVTLQDVIDALAALGLVASS